jgi:hypothetical protein
MMKARILATFILLVYSTLTFAHSESADFFRSTGKIYVVFAVILTIFAGIILALLSMERRLHKIENLLKSS